MLLRKPYGKWDIIITDYKFKVIEKFDSNDAKCQDTRSMTGSVVYLNGALVTFRNSNQKIVSLLTTKAELNVAVIGVQDALFVKNRLKSLGLKIKLPLLASIDNVGAVDIDKN